MTDLSPQRRAHLRKNAQSYGDDVLVEVLDALDTALTERDELRDALVNQIFAKTPTEEASDDSGATALTHYPEI